jgi:hypothetical protein
MGGRLGGKRREVAVRASEREAVIELIIISSISFET